MFSVHQIKIKILIVGCAAHLLFLFPHPAHAGMLSKAPNNLGLLAYWSFNEGSGTVATDFSGNAHPGTLTNGPTWTSGRASGGLDFNGADSEYISVGNVGTGVQTVAFWINADTTTEPIIDLNGSATIEVSSGTVTANNFTSPTIYVDGAASSTLTTGWHHVAITTGTGINASAVDIGRISSSYFDGVLDEVRVYNRVLSSTEVGQVYESGVVRFGISNEVDQIPDLLGWWTFDGPDLTTTTALDASGNGWNGTLGGGPRPTVGITGQALLFDDLDDRIQLTDVDFTTGGFTLSAWFRTTSTEPEFSSIVSKEPNSGGAGRIYLYYAGSIDQIEGSINDGAFQGVSCTGCGLNDGEWHHVLMRVTTSDLELFIDGVSQGTDTHDNGLTANNNPWFIGAKSATVNNWDGGIDDVRIYNRALTDPEISRLYDSSRPSTFNTTSSSGGLDSGLVGHWTFDGPDVVWSSSTAGTATDLSANGNDGTLTNMNQSSSVIDGVLGQALNFSSASTQYVDTNADLEFASGDMAVSAWFRTSTQADQRILSKFQSGADQSWIMLDSGGNVEAGAFSVSSLKSTSQRFDDGEWHHLLVNRSGSTTTLYVDGVIEDTDTAAYKSNNDATWHIGRRNNNAEYFNGAIDDVRFYNRALTTTEISRLYLMGS